MLQSKQSVGHVHRHRWFLGGHRCLLWVVLISLVFKTILAAIDGVINPDGVLYIAAAQQFAIGNFSEALKLYPMPAFPLMITMVVAAFVVHGADPFGKKELALLYGAGALTLMLTGAGRLSIDALVGWRRRRSSPR